MDRLRQTRAAARAERIAGSSEFVIKAAYTDQTRTGPDANLLVVEAIGRCRAVEQVQDLLCALATTDPAVTEPPLVRPADPHERRHMSFVQRDFHNRGLFLQVNPQFRGWRDLAFRTPEACYASGPGGIIGIISKTLAVWLRHTACLGDKRQQHHKNAPQLPMDSGGWVSKFAVRTRLNFLYAAPAISPRRCSWASFTASPRGGSTPAS